MGISFCKIFQKKKERLALLFTTHCSDTATATTHATFASRPLRSILLAKVLCLRSSTDVSRRKFFNISKIIREGRAYFPFFLLQHKALLLRERYFSLPNNTNNWVIIIPNSALSRRKSGTISYEILIDGKKLLNIVSALICSFECLTESRCAGNTWGRTKRSTVTTWCRQWYNIMNFLLVLLQRFTSLSYICVTNITAETNWIFLRTLTATKIWSMSSIYS